MIDTEPKGNAQEGGTSQQQRAKPEPSQPSDRFIKSCLTDDRFVKKLKPKHIKLSSAMAMSAAAVSPYLGKNEDAERQFTHFFTVFGIEMATDMVHNMTDENLGESFKDQFCWTVRL